MQRERPFVKSGSTKVPVTHSQSELERLLRRYGCAGFGVQHDYENQRARVNFRVPDGPENDAPLIPVALELNLRAVYDALHGQPKKRRWFEDKYITEFDPAGYDVKLMQQAERVAWRILKDWIEAQMALLDIEMVKMEEIFMPYIVDQKGQTLYEKLEQKQFLLEEL